MTEIKAIIYNQFWSYVLPMEVSLQGGMDPLMILYLIKRAKVCRSQSAKVSGEFTVKPSPNL